MPADEVTAPIEIGFGEFTARLISDVFDSVVASQFAQEQRLAELIAAAELPVEEFADRVVTDDETYEELANLFPGGSPQLPTSIVPGAPYRPARAGVEEEPPVEAVLGLKLRRGDYYTKRTKRGRTIVLGRRGVARVAAAVRTRLAEARHRTVREMVRRGLPRVIADAGRVNSKLTYEVVEAEPAGPAPAAATYPVVAAPPSRLRLIVRPADERAPQNRELQVNVFGEVEISFTTLT